MVLTPNPSPSPSPVTMGEGNQYGSKTTQMVREIVDSMAYKVVRKAKLTGVATSAEMPVSSKRPLVWLILKLTILSVAWLAASNH